MAGLLKKTADNEWKSDDGRFHLRPAAFGKGYILFDNAVEDSIGGRQIVKQHHCDTIRGAQGKARRIIGQTPLATAVWKARRAWFEFHVVEAAFVAAWSAASDKDREIFCSQNSFVTNVVDGRRVFADLGADCHDELFYDPLR